MPYLAKTNYFHVNDEREFYYLTGHTCNVNREPVRVLHQTDANGNKTFCIASTSAILGTFIEDFDSIQDGNICYAPSRFFNRLQNCLPDDEAVILIDLTPGDPEQQHDIEGQAHILTASAHEVVSLTEYAVKTAREILNKPDWFIDLGPLYY